MIRLLSILILCVLSVRVALGSVNVTNYGAWPDCLTLTNLTLTSNSVTVSLTGNATNSAGSRQFQAVDLGKLIEILAGGYYTGTSNCTFIGYITNVVSPTSVKVACSNGVLNNTIQATGSGFLGYFGSDSAPGFASAIAAAAVPNDTIYVPANSLGNTYLMAPRQAITGYPGGIGHKASVYIERGGLTFVGQSYTVPAITSYANGTPMLDTAGQKMQTFGGNIIKSGSTYYWVGADISATNASNASGGPDIAGWSGGVRMYSSSDLYNWTPIGLILTNPLSMGWLTRPKLAAVSGGFAIWAHGYNYPRVTSADRALIATSASITGPWSWANTNVNPEGLGFQDANLFTANDGTLWLIYSDQNQGGGSGYMHICGLTANGLGTNGARVALNTMTNEAPFMFQNGSNFFLGFGTEHDYSSNADWAPRYLLATNSPLGPWYVGQQPTGICVYDPRLPVLNSQPAWIQQVGTNYFYYGDNWRTNLRDSLEVLMPLAITATNAFQVVLQTNWTLAGLPYTTNANPYLALDTFYESDGGLGAPMVGSSWTCYSSGIATPVSDINIRNNSAFSSNSGSTVQAWVAAAANGTINLTFLAAPSTDFPMMIFRVQDYDNYWRVGPYSGIYYLQKIVAGSLSTVWSGGTFANGDNIKVVLSGSSISVYNNGTLLTTQTDSTFSTQTGTGIAFGSGTSTSAAVANFSMTP